MDFLDSIAPNFSSLYGILDSIAPNFSSFWYFGQITPYFGSLYGILDSIAPNFSSLYGILDRLLLSLVLCMVFWTDCS